MEWLYVGIGLVIIVAAAWVVFGAVGFRRNIRGPRK